MTTPNVIAQAAPEQSNDYSQLINDMHAAIDTDFDTLWTSMRHNPFDTPDELQEERDKAVAREHIFADKVVSATLQVSDTGAKPVTILFDVDETIVKKSYTREHPDGFDLVRPAFPRVVATLDTILGDKLSIGLLTTRGQSHLDEQLESPTFLKNVISKVDPEYVLSAREGSTASANLPGYGYDRHSLIREALSGFLNDELIYEDDIDTTHAIMRVTKSRMGWTGNKLPILKELLDTNPDRAFVYVDDAASASVINPDYSPNLATVQVYDDAAFWEL